MSDKNSKVDKVSDIIQVIQAGIDFYKDAILAIDNESIKNTFRKMITYKEAALQSLQPLAIAEQGEREEGGSVVVDARRMYAKFASMFASDLDHTYVKQLEEVEDHILEAFDDALKQEQPPHAMITLRTVRANAQQMHDEMKALQKATS